METLGLWVWVSYLQTHLIVGALDTYLENRSMDKRDRSYRWVASRTRAVCKGIKLAGAGSE